MKNIIAAYLCFMTFPNHAFCQSGKWVWMKGDTLFDKDGTIYAAPGIEDSSYLPPALYQASSWSDDSGRFWLFGGQDYNTNGTAYNWNRVWRYNPSNNEWAFMKGGDNWFGVYGTQGVPNSNNYPST